LIEVTAEQPPEWGTEMWQVSSERGPLLLFGYTQLSLIANEVYLFLKLLEKPRPSELKRLRPLFIQWAEGSRAVMSVKGEKERRFAEFFGLYDTGWDGPDGDIYVGVF